VKAEKGQSIQVCGTKKHEASHSAPGLRQVTHRDSAHLVLLTIALCVQALEREAQAEAQALRRQQLADRLSKQHQRLHGGKACTADNGLAEHHAAAWPQPTTNQQAGAHAGADWAATFPEGDHGSSSEESDGEGGRRQATDTMGGCAACHFSKVCGWYAWIVVGHAGQRLVEDLGLRMAC
jgi:hypothetical protein